ncbi:MAG: helix-turn-helix transcriptional regulator [Bacteroidota bacterium]
MDKENIIRIDAISTMIEMAGFQSPEHPLFAISRLEDLPPLPIPKGALVQFDFYSIGLKRCLQDTFRYGRQSYDFQRGVLGFTSPGQITEVNPEIGRTATGWMLFFHRDLLQNHPLRKTILNYGFFDYQVNEALHCSAKEEDTLEGIFTNMLNEYNNNIDLYSKPLVLANLELLLQYAERFYNRQFITRQEVSTGLGAQFETNLREFFQLEQYQEMGLPTVSYFADLLRVSPSYLSDYLRMSTGKSTQEHIHLALIERAKALLENPNQSVSEIAYELGFEYPSYFSRLFKAKTGVSPSLYRA